VQFPNGRPLGKLPTVFCRQRVDRHTRILADGKVLHQSKMPNSAAEYSSEYLSAEQMATALNALPAVLDRLFGGCVLTAYYGWAANLHGGLCWKPMKIHPGTLQFFIEDSIDQRIILPGQSDLLIDSPQEELRLLFCHVSPLPKWLHELGVNRVE
jgi:hypothetical protein